MMPEKPQKPKTELTPIEKDLIRAYQKGKQAGAKATQMEIEQLKAEVIGLEGCCQVLEKALGVPKKATLKQIDERIGELVLLEQNAKKAERERIWVLWRDTTRETNCTEDALVLFNNRLKAELEK